MPSQLPVSTGFLSSVVQRVPHTTSAVLLSSDGLVKSVHGLDQDSADHMAALACGLYALGRGAGVRFGDGGEVRQVVVELDSTLLFVSTAGSGTCLAVLAGREADAAVLGYEMACSSRESGLIWSPRPGSTPSSFRDEVLSVAAAGGRALARRGGGTPGAPLHRQRRPDPAEHRARPLPRSWPPEPTPGYLGPEHARRSNAAGHPSRSRRSPPI